MLRNCCGWRLIQKDLPPRSTTYGEFSRWCDDGLLTTIASAGAFLCVAAVMILVRRLVRSA